MKRVITTTLSCFLVCLLAVCTMLCAFAAPASTVNGVEAPVGSTVEYTMFLEAYKQDVVGIQMVFKFDTKHLELKNVDLSNFPSATLNANNQGDGMIYFNHSDLNGQSFSKSKELAKLTFEVISEGASDIVYLVQYLYDIDIVNIYDYTLTYSLSVDGNTKVENEAPILGDAEKIASEIEGSFDAGDFANNQAGTGSGIKPTEAPKNQTANISDNTSSVNNGNSNTSLYVIGGIVLFALVAVVVIITLRKNKFEE